MKQITMLLTNAFDPDVRVYKEAVYLVEQGFSVTILCWDREPEVGLPSREVQKGIEIVRFPIPAQFGSGKKQIPAFLAYIRACRNYLKHHRSDCLHCHDIDGAITGYLVRRHGTTMVFDMHELYEDVGEGHALLHRIWRMVTIFLIRCSRYALYENDLYLSRPYRSVQDKLLPLKNYPDSDLVRPLPKTSDKVFRIGYHGGVRGQIPQFTTLFEAVKDMEDVRVDIHGGGVDLPELKELEKRYGNVHIHGPFDGTSALSGLYADADIVYAGYRTTSYTVEYAEVVKFFECILTGTPLILTRAYTTMAKRIEEHGFGLTCDTLNVEEVRAAVLRLKDDKAFWVQCSQNERAHANQYDWKQAVQILDTVYQK